MTDHNRNQIENAFRCDNKSSNATHNAYTSKNWKVIKPCRVLAVPESDYLTPLEDAMTSNKLCVMEKIKLDYDNAKLDLPNIKLCFDIDCKNPEETSPVTDDNIPIINNILKDEIKEIYGFEIEDDEIMILRPLREGPAGAHIVVPGVILPRDLPLREAIYMRFVKTLRDRFFEETGAFLDVDKSILHGGFRLPFSEKESPLDAYYPRNWPMVDGMPKDPADCLDKIEDFHIDYCIHDYEFEPTEAVIEITPAPARNVQPIQPVAANLDANLDEMLTSLKDSTFDSREDCMKLIWSLRAINNDEATFGAIDKHMRRSRKYNDDPQWPRKIWEDYSDGKYNGRSFYWLVKRDNPEYFKTLAKTGKGSKWNPVHIAIFEGTDRAYAELFQQLSEEKFVFTTEPIESFWYTRNGRWFQDDSRGSQIRRTMAQTIPPPIRKYRDAEVKAIDAALEKVEDETQAIRLKEQRENTVKACYRAVRKMRNDAPLKKALNILKDDIADNNFINTLDSKPHLLGFDNGVYDLKTAEFRDYKVSDYVSYTTGYDYTDKPKAIDDVRNLLNTFFKEEQDTEYVLHLLADTLDGSNRHEEFHIMTGKGGNGKGLLFSFMEQALGTDYFRWLDSSYLTTQRKSSSGPQPEMADKHGCRILIASEPEEDQSLQVGKLKQISGGDKITARPMYAKHERSFTPQFSLIFQTNDIPKLSAYDQGVERRIRIVNFPYSFKDNPSGPMQRKIDRTLKDRIKDNEWRQSLMHILLSIRKDGRGRLVSTPNIRRSTEEYLRDNNPALELLKHYILTGNPADTVLTSEILRHFQEISPEINMNNRSIVYQLESNDVPTKRTKKGKAAYGIKRIPVRVMESIIAAEPSMEKYPITDFEREDLNSAEFLKAVKKIYPDMKVVNAATEGINLKPKQEFQEEQIQMDF